MKVDPGKVGKYQAGRQSMFCSVCCMNQLDNQLRNKRTYQATKATQMDVCRSNGYQAKRCKNNDECTETLPMQSASSTVPLKAVVRFVPHGIHSV